MNAMCVKPQSWTARLRRVTALGAVCILAAGAWAQPEAAGQSVPPAAPASAASAELTLKPADIVVPDGLAAKYTDRSHVSDIVTYRRPPRTRGLNPEEVPGLSAEAYRELAEYLAIDEVIYATAMKKNFVEQNEALKKRLEDIKDRLLIYQFYQENVAKKIKVTDDDLKAYYEENKKNFYRPYQFSMRHIFLSTYVPYTAKEGDTLEALAESISKDKEMVGFILTDDADKEARWVPPGERDEKLFKPLQPGEKLLVPMAKEDKEAVRKRLEDILAKLKEGADFEELAKEYSETEQKGILIGPLRPEMEEERGKPILPEILQAIDKTEVGQATGIVQTKHGFQIYKVEDKRPAHTQPFDEVKPVVERNVTNAKTEETVNQLYKSLGEKYKNDIKINRDLLKAESPSPNEILASAGDDMNITIQMFQSMTPNYRETVKTDEDLILALNKVRDFNTYLLKRAANDAGVAQTDAYKKALHEVNISMVVPEFLNQVVESSLSMTDAELKKFYEDNKEQYKIPEQVDLYLIGQKIDENFAALSDEERVSKSESAKNALAETLKNVKTLDDFKAIASEISSDPSKANMGHVGLVPLSYRNGFNGVLNTLEPGKMSNPVEYGNSVYVAWITERKTDSYRPFDEAIDTVKNNYRAVNSNRIVEQVRQMAAQAAGIDKMLESPVQAQPAPAPEN